MRNYEQIIRAGKMAEIVVLFTQWQETVNEPSAQLHFLRFCGKDVVLINDSTPYLPGEEPRTWFNVTGLDDSIKELKEAIEYGNRINENWK